MTSPKLRHFLTLTGLVGLMPFAAYASRSGLNNIPTADVSAPGVAVVHLYSGWGTGRDASFLTGLRSGFDVNELKFEGGVDSRWEPGVIVPAILNAKWQLPLKMAPVTAAIGIANLGLTADDRDEIGQPQSYAILSWNLGSFRLHGGYGWQHQNPTAFVGFDTSFNIVERKLVVRCDARQIQDQGQWVGSIGLTYRFAEIVGLEVSHSHPFDTGEDYTSAKLALYFKY